MSDLARLGLHDPVEPTGAKPSSEVSSGQISPLEKNVAGFGKVPSEDLYAHRAAIAERNRQEAAARPLQVNLSRIIAVALGVVAVAALAGVLVFAGPMFFRSNAENLSVDLGTQKYDPAGLSGRLIAQWTGSAGYKLTINPLDPDHISGFRATITNRPHAITFRVRLKDATGGVACQKDIVIPGTQELSDPTSRSHALAERTTPTGDTMQDIAGKNGQMSEMDLAGPLSCTLEEYKQIVAWDFTEDLSPLSAQKKWKKHEDAVTEEASKAQPDSASVPRPFADYPFIKSLPAPIEAEDVVAWDNPSKGVVATADGHSFLVGSDVLANPALDWQVFPVDVHYRCDKNALCTVTRPDSPSVLHARLLQ
jgi:hypothetical protein